MKWTIALVFSFVWGAFVTHQALAETYVIVDEKAYTLVEIDGELLVSNEWEPTTKKGYTDEYLASEQYQTIKAANESLKRIKDGVL